MSIELDSKYEDALLTKRKAYLAAMFWQTATVDDIIFWKSEVLKIEKELNWCDVTPIQEGE